MRNRTCLFTSIGLIIFPSIFLSGQKDSLTKKGGTPFKEVAALSDSLETLMKDFFSMKKQSLRTKLSQLEKAFNNAVNIRDMKSKFVKLAKVD